MAVRLALILAILLAAPFASAQTKADIDEPHRLAGVFLERMHADTMMEGLLVGTRQAIVVIFEGYGKTEKQSGEIFDEFMMPEFKARLPELLTKFQDILVQDFTLEELHSIVDDRHDAARASAAAKAPQLQPQFTEAGQRWGSQVGMDVYAKNATTLKKLGLDLESQPK